MPLLKSMTSRDTYPSTPASWVCSLSHLHNQVNILLLPPSSALCEFGHWSSSLAAQMCTHVITVLRHVILHPYGTRSASCEMPTTQHHHRAWHACFECNSTAPCTEARCELLCNLLLVDACVVHTDQGHQECGPRWSVTTVTSGQVTKVSMLYDYPALEGFISRFIRQQTICWLPAESWP